MIFIQTLFLSPSVQTPAADSTRNILSIEYYQNFFLKKGRQRVQNGIY
ncbi:hypothetical protein H3019_gp28 [Bacillus phage Karezi]|uniref:Uncharacterized protein n=1 Tax=Bacillus phage Karezi TaxID=2591398 RepID=A0A514AAR9_9CAUD|nr:hypothetical protein H3019_gp28 [Bacillus phage Karezi]QDH50362.1 hypothetical protein KAREZI_28 [Bacillus phage Karezi]